MKRCAYLILTVFMVSFMLLSGCGLPENAEETAGKIRVKYLGQEVCTLSAKIIADYGENCYEYGIRYTGNESSGVTEVMYPESIAGFKIAIADGKVDTSFDDTVLYMGEMSDFKITPACAVPAMIGSWKSGYITNSKKENLDGVSTVCLTICIDDETETRTWFDESTLEPIKSEIVNGGRTVVFAEFEINTDDIRVEP